MIFPEIKYEDWILRYPGLKLNDDCEINFCNSCNQRIQPNIPFVKKGYVGLLIESCPHCGKTNRMKVSLTNSESELNKWSRIL